MAIPQQRGLNETELSKVTAPSDLPLRFLLDVSLILTGNRNLDTSYFRLRLAVCAIDCGMGGATCGSLASKIVNCLSSTREGTTRMISHGVDKDNTYSVGRLEVWL